MMLRFFLAALLFVVSAAAQDLDNHVKRLTDAYALVEQNAADPVSSEQAFYQGVIPGMLRRLDPHSVFFDPQQFEQLKKLETSTQKGFGSVVSVLPGRVIVLQTMPGTPSAKSGMSPGDEILAINNYGSTGWIWNSWSACCSNPSSSRRSWWSGGPETCACCEFTLTPEEMQSPSVERAFFLKPGIGYLRVSSFDEKTGAQIKEAIEKLGGAKLKGLVLDLRNNPGGLLTAALADGLAVLEARADDPDGARPRGSAERRKGSRGRSAVRFSSCGADQRQRAPAPRRS